MRRPHPPAHAWRAAGTLLCAILVGRAAASEWLGRTEERVDDPTRCGLGKPRVTTASYPRVWGLDIDRDGDIDALRVVRSEPRTTIQLEICAPDGRLVPAWSRTLDVPAGAEVTFVCAAHVTDGRQLALIVEISRAPYLIAFFDAAAGGAAPPDATPLNRRFPDRPSAPGTAVEPYLRLAQVMDWNGDGLDDLLVVAHAAATDPRGETRVVRHALYMLAGGAKLKERAEEVLDLTTLGTRARLCTLADFDGDGAPEMLVECEHARGGGVTAGELLCIRKYGGSLRQEAAWPTTARDLACVLIRDLNGDKIPDCVLADHASRQILVLRSRRQEGRPFAFEPQLVALPAGALAGAPRNTAFFAADLNADGVTDFFTVATDHNQLARIIVGRDGSLAPSLEMLPRLPTAPPAAGENWHAKAIWFGDADRDGAPELLVMTNEPLDPDFLPPRDPTIQRDKLIQSILTAGGERRHYAPYFRLMVLRVGAASITCAGVFNTQLGAHGYDPFEILLGNFDADPQEELVLEAVPRSGGRPSQAVFEITGRLPSAAQAPEAGAPPR